jgi:glycosyltransferase involved in cell wall biosynthesis
MVGGEIPHDQMHLYYNAADVALQTAELEGSPTIVKEALACELPIVSTDVGDTAELVEGIPGCWVCDGDADTLAGCLQHAIGQKALGGRERLYGKGLSLDQVATRVISVYNRVLAANAPN